MYFWIRIIQKDGADHKHHIIYTYSTVSGTLPNLVSDIILLILGKQWRNEIIQLFNHDLILNTSLNSFQSSGKVGSKPKKWLNYYTRVASVNAQSPKIARKKTLTKQIVVL